MFLTFDIQTSASNNAKPIGTFKKRVGSISFSILELSDLNEQHTCFIVYPFTHPVIILELALCMMIVVVIIARGVIGPSRADTMPSLNSTRNSIFDTRLESSFVFQVRARFEMKIELLELA